MQALSLFVVTCGPGSKKNQSNRNKSGNCNRPGLNLVHRPRGDNVKEILGAMAKWKQNGASENFREPKFFCYQNDMNFRLLPYIRFSPNLVKRRETYWKRFSKILRLRVIYPRKTSKLNGSDRPHSHGRPQARARGVIWPPGRLKHSSVTAS